MTGPSDEDFAAAAGEFGELVAALDGVARLKRWLGGDYLGELVAAHVVRALRTGDGAPMIGVRMIVETPVKSVLLYRGNPFLRERMQEPGPDARLWEKALLRLPCVCRRANTIIVPAFYVWSAIRAL